MNYSLVKGLNLLPCNVTRRGIAHSWRILPCSQYKSYSRAHSHPQSILVSKFSCVANHSRDTRLVGRVWNDTTSVHKFQVRTFHQHSSLKPSPLQPWKVASCRHFSQENEDKDKSKQLPFIGGGLVASLFAGAVIYKMFFSESISSEAVVEGITPEKPVKKLKHPENSDDFPEKIPYLLIGGGTASFSAFRAIKAIDPLAKVLMITNESYYPYMRPPLSKELILSRSKNIEKNLSFIQWDGSERSVYYEPEEFYVSCSELMESETGGVSVARGWKIASLNPDSKYVVLENGKKINYNKCLLATGARPKNLPVFLKRWSEVQKKVSLYRSLEDYLRLEEAIANGAKSIAIIGGGFSGSELASALARRGLNVTQIFKENSNMAQVLPDYLSKWLSLKLEKQGVHLARQTEVTDVRIAEDKVQLLTTNDKAILADHVIVAAGVEPNTSLASSAGLEVDSTFGGFVVNSELEARRDLFAAGDCACFYDRQLGRRRVEHHDHAVVSGRLAGENMTGAAKAFEHQSMFWSDLGPGLGYEAIGIIDSSLPSVSVFMEEAKRPRESQVEGSLESSENAQLVPLKSESSENFSSDSTPKGVVFYLKNEKIVGIVMWNLFNRIEMARQVLRNNLTLNEVKEAAKYFKMHDKISE